MLTITNVSKNYGKTEALKDVSLTIPTGSCFGLVGPNGAGKSTIIKLIATILEDYNGTITYDNASLQKESKQMLGYVPQEICLEQSVSARNNLAFFGSLYNLKGKDLQHRIDEVLNEVGLLEKGNDRVHTFSGGMKRRLNIGCALMHDPTFIIMDEPTVGIDPQSRNYIFNMIGQLVQSGKTILYASHYMEEIEQLCEKIAFIDQGKVVETGTIDALLQTYAIPSVFIKGDALSLRSFEQLGKISEKRGGYVLTTKHPLYAMEHIVQYCRKNNISLDRLELMQPRLEDVFFSLTGSQLRDNS